VLKKQTLHLFVFADALGWKMAQQRKFLEDLLPHRQELATLLGYSCTCDPTILTGVQPDEHGHFSFYTFAPGRSPFGWARWLGWLPQSVAAHHRIRNRVSRWTAARLGYTGYFQLYSVPFNRLPWLDYTEKRDIYAPGGILGGQETIFARWDRSGLPWMRSDWRRGDAENVAQLLAAVRQGDIQLAYLFTSGLDAIMHKYGTEHRAVDEAFARFGGWLHEICAASRQHYSEIRLHVFSDHGMVDTQAASTLMLEFEELGLSYGHDYAAVWDSTMVRFWFPGGDAVRAKVSAWLKAHPVGRILSRAELEQWHCYYPDHRYGELFYLLPSGTIFAPSYMNRGFVTGMHGFAPNEPGNAACLLSTHPLTRPVRQLSELHGLMAQAAGL